MAFMCKRGPNRTHRTVYASAYFLRVLCSCKRPPIFFYVLNIKQFTSDNTSPNTKTKTFMTLNLTLNGCKDAHIISHSKFLPKVVGWLGMWRTTVSLGPRLHILAKKITWLASSLYLLD